MDKTTFNDDIGNWDVSSVTNMERMFQTCRGFNQDISGWDVSDLTTMSSMFHDSWNFNADISSWDVSNVTTMRMTFEDARKFNQDISSWDVSSVTNMELTFVRALDFNQNISGWDVSNVTTMDYLFWSASSFNQDISAWDVSNVTTMAEIFYLANGLSDENKCAIHTAWSSNNAWPYDWSEFCAIDGYTFVPDDNFEQALIDLGYDDVLDDYVITDSISGVTSLDVGEKGISDLTGIEDFTALTALYCNHNELTTLDVSSNQALAEINARNNQISSIDVSNNPSLTHITLHNNEISSIDVSNNSLLVALGIAFNNLTSINVDNNPELEVLHFLGNDVANLDISSHSALELLNAMGNNLSSINLSNNTALTELYIGGNDLTSLDVSNNSLLTAFTCENNNIDSLDVSNIQNSWKFDFQNNQMVYLNMRNGNTSSSYFKATGNSLTCIETLDPVSATENWTDIDEGVTFSVICGAEEQDVWHVATNGSDGSGNGTQESPFATIQMGINAAGNGNTVQVAAGTYLAPNEPYYGNDDSAGPNLYEKEDLAILGDGSATTIIDMDGHTYGFCFSRNSMNNIIDGFTIKNGGYTLITAYNNSWGNTFQNCVLLTDGGENYTYESYDSGDYFINCTFVGNGNNDVHYDYETQSVFTNSIFYHFDDFINENYLESITVSNSLFYEVDGGLPEGETLIFQDPLFCEPDSGNYHLAGNSPSAGTGEDGADMGALGVGCGDIWFPPTIAAMADTSMDEDSELMLQLSAESEQGYDIFFEAESDTSSVYVYTEDDMLHINLEPDWNGLSVITIMAYSEFDYEINNTTSFSLTVNPVNDEPVFHNLHRLVAAGMEFHVPIHVSDIDMDSLVVSFDESWDYPDWLSLTDNPYALTGTAPEPASIHFPLHVSDGESHGDGHVPPIGPVL